MITVGNLRNGSTYLTQHLRKNDYWAEGENEIRGEWIGEGAKALGLFGEVTDAPFNALRENRHPLNGEQLTAREYKNRVALIDIQLSVPKDVSVLAMVGGDNRIRTAFVDSVKIVLAEMERFAAVRERRGDAASSEQYRLTGNYVRALFVHDIYLSNKDEILRRIAFPDTDRELAKEFMERHGLAENEHLVPRPVRKLGAHLRDAWLAAAEKLRRTKTQSERQRI